jgi:hypothetical protein
MAKLPLIPPSNPIVSIKITFWQFCMLTISYNTPGHKIPSMGISLTLRAKPASSSIFSGELQNLLL